MKNDSRYVYIVTRQDNETKNTITYLVYDSQDEAEQATDVLNSVIKAATFYVQRMKVFSKDS